MKLAARIVLVAALIASLSAQTAKKRTPSPGLCRLVYEIPDEARPLPTEGDGEEFVGIALRVLLADGIVALVDGEPIGLTANNASWVRLPVPPCVDFPCTRPLLRVVIFADSDVSGSIRVLYRNGDRGSEVPLKSSCP